VLVAVSSFRSYPPPRYPDPPPPHLHERYAGFDFPDEWTESLKTTLERVAPYFETNIAPVLKSGKTVIIAAHGNSLRALVKGLDGIGEDVIAELNIPTGTPLVYELDDDMRPIPQEGSFGPLNGRYLGDQDAIRARIEGVKNQTK
jgi:2,3-bisphosphoglycerate-dependent phosphoglycerate mutase